MQSRLPHHIRGIHIRTPGQVLFDSFNVPLFGSLNKRLTLRRPEPLQQHGRE